MPRTRRSRAETRTVSANDPSVVPGSAYDDELLDIDVPTVDDINEPPNELRLYKVMLYGEKSLGKTSISSQFPGTFTLQFDPDRRNIRLRQQIIRPYTLDQLQGLPPEQDPWRIAKTLIVKAASDPSVEVLHIDNFARYVECATNSFCAHNGIEDPSELSENWAAGWRKVKGMYQSLISAWGDTGKGLILTAHGKMHKIKPKDGSKAYEMYGPDLTDSVWSYVKEVCDYCFALDMDPNGNRILHLRANPMIWAANGSSDYFLDPEGKPLDCVPLGKTPEESYKVITQAFNNNVYDDSESMGTPRYGTEAAGSERKPKSASRKRRKS